jgi:hypothetical protein
VSIRNWKHFRWPYEPMQHFTRSEPFPANEKATSIDGKPRRRPKVRASDALRSMLAQKVAR